MRRLALLGIAVAIAAAIVSAKAYAADYVIDQERTELVVRLFKGGIAAAVAHNHVIRATEYTGGASFDPNDSEAASIWVEARATSLEADEPAVREKYGLGKRISEKDRLKIRATMLSPEQMDVENYPIIAFRSTSVEAQSEGRYSIAGDLTIHGITQHVSFPVTVKEEGGELSGSATINFRQSDFGIRPYRAMFGAVRNKDEAVLYAEVVLTPRPIGLTGND